MLIKSRYVAMISLISVFGVTVFNPAFGEQPLLKKQTAYPHDVKSKIQNLSEAQFAKTSANYLLINPRNQNFVPQISQATTDVVSVIDVKVNSTDKRIELILVMANSKKLQVSPKIEGNSYIADIKNAKLQLTSGESFRQEKPVAGIAEVTIANVDANTLRVRVVGETSAPTVELFDSRTEGLVLEVTPATSTAQQPTAPEQKPQTEQQPPIELEVTAPPDTYRAPNASVGTKTDTPLRDVPATVQVFPRQVIDDLGTNRIGDVVRTVGIGSPTFPSRLFDNFSIRGFAVSNANTFRNGLKDVNSGYAINTANLERIEVLRGPASVLYGQITPGGLVNRVTKQPLSDPYYFAFMRVGTYETYQPAIDFSGPLNPERTLLYRLNASYLSTNSFVDFTNEQRYFVAPAFSVQISNNTRLTVEGEYQNVEKPDGDGEIPGLPAIGTVLPNPNGKIERDRNLGEPSTDSESRQVSRIAYYLEHRFDQNWVLRNAFQFAQNSTTESATSTGTLRSDNRTVNRTSLFQSNILNNYIVDTNVTGEFKTGSIEHKLLFGFDLFWQDFDRPQFINYARTPIDIFNPVYGSPLGQITSRSNTLSSNNAQGLYAQDQISLIDNLKFVLGGRFDFLNADSLDRTSGVKTSQYNDAFSPRLGIVYQPNKNVSLYASYSRSFEQVTGTDARNNPFVPSRGTQYEVGVKTDLFNNKLSATLALFDLTRTNITTADLNNPGL